MDQAGPKEHLTGKMFDTVTGMYYFHARWYDPQVGRFVGRDPLSDIRMIGRSDYGFCLNNPYLYSDPSGRKPSWEDCISYVNDYILNDETWNRISFFADKYKDIVDRCSSFFDKEYQNGDSCLYTLCDRKYRGKANREHKVRCCIKRHDDWCRLEIRAGKCLDNLRKQNIDDLVGMVKGAAKCTGYKPAEIVATTWGKVTEKIADDMIEVLNCEDIPPEFPEHYNRRQ
jgi:RHS repeat-associated protein